MRLRILIASSIVLLLSSMIVAAPVNGSASTAKPLLQRDQDSGFVPAVALVTAWYPEQWPESRWDTDLALMQKAGINVVRVGEFAWSRMEPSEGQFDFGWLDRAVALAGKHRIKVVLGTPTAAPPAWLTYKYPDTLAVWANGERAKHGNREQYRFTSRRYLEFCRRIAEEMAKHFGHNPDVIGWQIDNEYGPVSYDAETQRDFQTFLQARYGTLESLNRHWATEYWSQTYDDWREIPIPVGYNNPGLMLEWKRFITQTFVRYQQNQVDVIRRYADPRQFITHNFMGFDGNFDHYPVSGALDFASWDNYVGQGHFDFLSTGMAQDLTRGFKRQNYWVMETQPGAVNWAGINNTLDKGEIRRMAWDDIGHGADAVGYWQWRSAPGGQEQYHGTLIGADGNPRPIYEEVAQIGREFAKAAPELRDTTPKPEVALLFDYDSRWAIEFQRHNKNFDPVAYLNTFYRPLRERGVDVDIVHPLAPLESYKLVIASGLNVLSPRVAEALVTYVKHGGHLVLGARSGMKDEYNALLPSRQPGTSLSQLLGGDVVDFYALNREVPVSGELGSGEAKIWAERLETTSPGTGVLLRFGKSNGWLDNEPAVITHKIGSGTITYVGGEFNDAIMGALANWMLETAGVKPLIDHVPEGVEICRRIGEGGKQVLIAINNTTSSQTVTLPMAMREVLRDEATATTLTLAAGDVAVLVPER